MSTMPRLIRVLIAFACLAYVAEGRLFEQMATKPSDDEPSSSKSSERAPSSSSASSSSLLSAVSIDTASNKFASFVNSSKLELKGRNNSTSMCEHIRPDELPDECYCSEPGPFSLVIECLKTFNSTYLNDTIGMKIILDPCDEEGAKLALDVTEKEHEIDYTLVGIVAGESKNVPIPGLAMIVPGVGNVGLDVAVFIAGNPDMLRLKIGLNACAQLSTDHQMCASSIPGVSSILPWYILEGNYSFGDICASNRVEADADNNSTTTTTTTILVE